MHKPSPAESSRFPTEELELPQVQLACMFSLPFMPRPPGFPAGSVVKNLPAIQEAQEMQVRSLGGEDSLGEGMATPSSILAWRIPWTEEPGELWSTGSQRVGYD